MRICQRYQCDNKAIWISVPKNINDNCGHFCNKCKEELSNPKFSDKFQIFVKCDIS